MEEEKQTTRETDDNKKFLISIAIIVFALAVTAIVYFTGRVDRNENSPPDNTPTPTLLQSTPTPINELTPASTESATQVLNDWIVYDETGTNFILFYPPDFEIRDNQDGSVAFVKLGPTQTEGIEVYDGIILTVDSDTYDNDSFIDFVKEKYQEAQQSPVSEIGEITQGLTNNKTTYQYIEEGLGTFTHIYIPSENNSYIHVTILVADPTGAGFEETANTIISTIDHKE